MTMAKTGMRSETRQPRWHAGRVSQPPFTGCLSSKWSFTGRGEYYDDYQGFTTGTAQILKEVTATAEYKLVKGLLWRAEYRYDDSNKKFFTRGTLPCLLSGGTFTQNSCPADFGLGNTKSQNTITIGVVGYFGH